MPKTIEYECLDLGRALIPAARLMPTLAPNMKLEAAPTAAA